MSPRRRARKEPVWPLLVVLVVVGGGLGLGALFSGGSDDGPPVVEDLPGEMGLPEPGARIRVEVLNAGGIQGAAAEVTERLRAEGFDVVYFGNASSFDSGPTVVLDRTGMASAARAVAGSLGDAAVRAESDSTRLVDVTVLVGADWPRLAASGSAFDSTTFVGLGEPEERRPWWDVRRFFSGAR